LVLNTAVAMVGCGFGGGVVAEPRVFELPPLMSRIAADSDSAEASKAGASGEPRVTRRPIIFSELIAPVRLDQRIAVIDAATGERTYLAGVQWADRPNRLLSDRLRIAIRSAGVFSGVVRRPVGEPSYELRVQLLAFELVHPRGAGVQARVAIDAYLIDLGLGKTVWSGAIDRRAEPSSSTTEGLIRAFADTFDEIVTKLCLRLRSEVEEYEATLSVERQDGAG
jgi:ABC-type uncharacterized transport system auxiliary subunit